MSKYDELEKLANLKKEGTISEDEFNIEKQKILSENESNNSPNDKETVKIKRDVSVNERKKNKRLVIITGIIAILSMIFLQWYAITIFILIAFIYLVQINERFRIFTSIVLIISTIIGIVIIFYLNSQLSINKFSYDLSHNSIYSLSYNERHDQIIESIFKVGAFSTLTLIIGLYLILTRKLKNKMN